MRDSDCIEFLQWALPQLRLRWAGYRRVRGQVRKRIARRMRELDLNDIAHYKNRLTTHEEEWAVLDSFCQIPISRFYRDRGVWDRLHAEHLPDLVRYALDRGEKTVHCWSAGCASGEEAYTLKLVWELSVRPALSTDVSLHIGATDTDPNLLRRAHKGEYNNNSVKELPREWIDRAFSHDEDVYTIDGRFKERVDFIEQDIRQSIPTQSFDLILCRNLVFTYFEENLQAALARDIVGRLKPSGLLVIGIHESLPDEAGLELISPAIYRKS